MSALVAGALLIAALAAVVALLALREARSRRAVSEPLYVIRDATTFALEAVDPPVRERLGKAGVGRILEWSAHYLQGLAVPAARRRGLRVVAGGAEGAIDYIRESLRKKGFDYSREDVAAVLVAEAEYLVSIGAVGDAVSRTEAETV